MTEMEEGFFDLYRRLGNVVGCEINNSHNTLREHLMVLYVLLFINIILTITILVSNNNNNCCCDDVYNTTTTTTITTYTLNSNGTLHEKENSQTLVIKNQKDTHGL